MSIEIAEPDKHFFPILKRYSEGKISAYNAACEIQDMNIPGFHDPSASEVVIWAKMAGYGIPTPSREAAEKEANEILKKLSDS